jgi:SpoIIAA-like
MALDIIGSDGPIVRAKISGELSRSEVNRIQVAALEGIRRYGKISALFILENFQGWKRAGDWGDVSFLTEHDKEIAKIAVMGEDKWRDPIYAFLAKGFREAEVEFFPSEDLAKARAWLEADNPSKP